MHYPFKSFFYIKDFRTRLAASSPLGAHAVQAHIPVFMKEQSDLCPCRIEYCCNPILKLKLDRLGYTPFSHLLGMCVRKTDTGTDGTLKLLYEQIHLAMQE